MKLIIFNSFKNNNLTCNCKLWCCCPVESNPCQTPRTITMENTFKTDYLKPFMDAFEEGQDIFEICITIKPEILNPHHIKGKTHIDIFNTIEWRIKCFLRKHKLDTTKLILITEYSEKSLRLHFHGCIMRPFSEEKGNLLCSYMQKYIGRTSCAYVKHKNYFEYIMKDTHKNYSIPGFMLIN